MTRNPILFVLVFSGIILVIDLISYLGIRRMLAGFRPRGRRFVRILFWVIPSFMIGGVIVFAIPNFIHPANFLVYFHYLSGALLLFYIPKLVFIIFYLLDEVYFFVRDRIRKVRTSRKPHEGAPMTRAQFLTRAGFVIAGLPFISIAYGIKWGRFDFTVRRYTLELPRLPAAFDGLRIVQVSDFHIGSFLNNIHQVATAVDLINEQEADLLLFTGDFVNNVSSEVDAFLPILSRMYAKVGRYSILGNHDYGDYVPWRSIHEKQDNLKRLVRLQEEIGFTMLLNSSKRIERNGSAIELVGVENWGLPPFPQYGDLEVALSEVSPDAFKILMTHDPTHWDEQVLQQTDIDLTLSGHTHGAQFGIEIPGWRWSPVDLRYKRWGGMYTEGNQHLHVNTGIGFIGFPGRVGMPPEITVIELGVTSLKNILKMH